MNYRKRYRILTARGVDMSLVPAAPAARHLTRLIDLGWTHHALAAAIGNQGMRSTLINLTDGRHERIERRTAIAVMSLRYTYAVPDRVPDAAFVPAEGAARRIRGLFAIGWTRDSLHARLERTNITHLARGMHPQIKAYRWRDVADLYADLHMTPGPSSINTARSAGLGYPVPFAWDDVDDPSEKPKRATFKPRKTNTPDHLAAEWEHLRSLGVSIHQAAIQLGVTVDAIELAVRKRKKVAA